MGSTVHQGRIWVILDKQGKLMADIDTDQIYHNAFLHITELSEMGQYAMGNLEGWKDFSQKAGPGDIIVAGRNFGAGSSRQQAVDCFISLKIGCLLAPSFGAIYYRNAVNSGFPLLRAPQLDELVAQKGLETGNLVEIDFRKGRGRNISKNIIFPFDPMSQVQYDIFMAGNLFNYGKTIK
jgi:3-isopropylmalate/(R)-2-methylmalate dehydratase small subunit